MTVHDQLRHDSTMHLQNLLRTDTQSPLGNEILAAEVIRAALEAENIGCEFLESAPGRVTAVARLQATAPTGRPLLLMGHIDVVTVERERWDRDPFGGDLDDDGYIWGRGALDMKGQVAAELAAFIAIAREGIPLKRDLIFVAFADEEAGGTYGAEWVWNNHREKINAEFAINEGGGTPIELGGTTFFTCQVGEKGSTGLKMTVRGRPGHASVPIEGTAMQALPEALRRLDAIEHPTHLVASVRLMLSAIADSLGGEDGNRIHAVLNNPTPTIADIDSLPLPDSWREIMRAVTRNTTVPTMISGGQQLNVIPGDITVNIDGRLLPGADPEAFRKTVQEAVGDLAEIEFLYPTPQVGIEADPQGELFDAIQATMSDIAPGSVVIPTLMSGGTDAAALPGLKVYGFFPTLLTERLEIYDPLVHGHNERVHVDDLAFGATCIYELAKRVCGA